MKKPFSLLVLLLMLSVQGYSQATSGTWQVGLLVGPSRAFYHEHPINAKTKIRSTSGLSLQHQFTKFQIKADLLLENKGASITYPGQPQIGPDPVMIDRTQDYTVQFNRDYLTVPVMVGMPLLKSRFIVNLGGYMGILLKATREEPQIGKTSEEGEKTLDYGLAGGIGYSHPLTSALHLSAEIRHNYGLCNISSGPARIYISSTNLLFGLQYALGKK